MARWRPVFGLVVLPVLFLVLLVRPSPAFQDNGADPPQPTATAPVPESGVPPVPAGEASTGDVPPDAEIDWSTIELINEPEPAPAAPALEMPLPSEAVEPAVAEPAANTFTTHVVARGENLSRIASRYGVSVELLRSANQIPNQNLIYVGQILQIPSAGSAPPAAPEVRTVPVEPAGGDSYVVQPGDSLYQIARRFGTSVAALAAANNLANPNALQPGQVLQLAAAPAPTAPVAAAPVATATAVPTAVPPPPANNESTASGNRYTVQKGDSLYKIAQRFGTTVQALAAANNLSNVNRLQVGQELVIPDSTEAGASLSAAAPNPVPAAPPPSFIWPLQGRLLQYYRWGHTGIDIEAVVGTEIVAAAAGVVEYAGWNSAGYGNLTIIDHGNGMRTLYAHQSAFLVEKDQQVEQGQVIGKSGSTGWSTWPHLHLEIIVNLRRVNPCSQLPGGC